jgi:plastocyanin
MVIAYARHHRATALATVVFALLLVTCGSSTTKTSSSAPAVSVTLTSAITVVIKNFGYMPANFTVPPGATVTVRNEDKGIHTITADNMAFNTGNVPQGLPATFTAPTQPGRYPFHCYLHNYMTGILTVS